MGLQAGTVARQVGLEHQFANLRQGQISRLPQRLAILAQGASVASYTPNVGVQYTSSQQVGAVAGFGSPAHLASLMIFPKDGDGAGIVPVTFYLLEDESGAAASDGDITPSGTQVGAESYRVVLNGIASAPFVVPDQQVPDNALAVLIAAAINANVNMPVVAVDNINAIDLTSKWKGTSANDLVISIVDSNGDAPANGLTFAFTQPVGGLVNPDVTDATAQIPNAVWETIIVNALEMTDATALDAYRDFGNLRASATVKAPLMVFTGSGEPSAALIAITDPRKSDRINAIVTATGSPNLPVQIAARVAARVARVANDNPPTDYGRRSLAPLVPGSDVSQEDNAQKRVAILAGASTSAVVNGLAVMGDTITCYHPDGEDPPAYRHVVDSVGKLWQVIYNLRREFEQAEWDGAPLIPDNQPTNNPLAKSPKDAVAAANVILDGLALAAIISDPEAAKALTVCVIDSENPKRINLEVTVQLSGNTNIISIDLAFGFFFGTLPIL